MTTPLLNVEHDIVRRLRADMAELIGVPCAAEPPPLAETFANPAAVLLALARGERQFDGLGYQAPPEIPEAPEALPTPGAAASS